MFSFVAGVLCATAVAVSLLIIYKYCWKTMNESVHKQLPDSPPLSDDIVLPPTTKPLEELKMKDNAADTDM